jgi:hypothetical protein
VGLVEVFGFGVFLDCDSQEELQELRAGEQFLV